MNKLFAIVGIALAVTVVLVIRQERGKEWVRYQRTFVQEQRCTEGIELKQAQAPEAEEQVAAKPKQQLLARVPEMKQIYIKDLNLADRCVTCHLGISDTACVGEEEPFNAHPGNFLKDHPVEKFGCTSCHGGQGLATTMKEAHGEAEGSTSPSLPMRYAYGYCGRCHKESGFRAAPQLTEGKRLFRKLGCPSCHEVKGYEGFQKAGPALSLVGTKVREDWLEEYLLSPKKYWKEGAMPDYRFQREQARAIAASMMTLKGKSPASEADDELKGYGPSIGNGKKLFSDAGCLTCHEVQGLYYKGLEGVEKIGPELTRIAAKVNREWLVSYLRDPRRYLPATRMPSFRFTPEQASDLAEYLFSFYGAKGNGDESTGPSSPAKSLIDEGRKLVKDYNCAGCHEIEGIEAGKPGPELTDIGNKPGNRLDYGENPPGAGRNLPNWLYAKVMTPHTFRPDTAKMPYPNINNPEADAIVTYLLTLTKDSFPEKYIVRDEGRPQRLYPLGGMVKQMFDEFKCLSCHPLGTAGELIGPQLAFEGNRVSRKWIENYLEKPTIIRPSLAAKMPKFKFTREERERLAEHSSHILLDDRIKESDADGVDGYKGDELEGKKLFSRKLACIACHRIEGKGGIVGPDLTRARERLKLQWLRIWLKDPQSFLPQVRMPNFGLSDEEIASLAGYILARKSDATEPEERRVLGKPEQIVEEDILASIEILRRKFAPGESTFMRYCSPCHGENGDGKGYNAQFLPREPRNFTDAEYMSKKSDEDLLNVISGGGMSAGLSFLMPPWGRTLDEEQIRSVISYIRGFANSP